MEAPHCPDNDRLAAYLKGALSEPEALAVEEHLSQCDTCESAVRTLDDLSDALGSVFREAAVPCEPLASDPQFRQAVEAICKLAEGNKGPEEESPRDEDRPQPTKPRTLGEYELLERLGGGGMGTVFKALHTRLNRVVAIKMLPEGRHENAAANFRFDREMRPVGSLDHANIVRASDAREIDGRRILVMEFVDGMDLAKLVREYGPLPIAEACELIRQAALGLQSAHEGGLVHRDIKPSNLMLTILPSPAGRGAGGEGMVKVLDLGLAFFHARPTTETEMTDSGQTVGTAEFMAPEQVSDSHQVDIRADIYGLGCTLYKLLSGHAPFDFPRYRTRLEKMAAHLRDPIPPIRAERKDVPETLAAVLEKMLAKSPSQRYATPAEVADALASFCAPCDLPAVLSRAERGEAGKAAANTTELCSSALESTGGTKRAGQPGRAEARNDAADLGQPRARRRWRGPAVLVAVLAAAAVLAFLTVFLLRTRPGTVAIDVDPPGAEVSIDDGKITLVVPQVKEPIEIRLTPGEHTFEVHIKVDLATKTGSFTLAAGGRQVLAVKLQESPSPAVARADSQPLVRLPAVESLVGADGKWKLPPGAPPPAVAPFDAATAKQHQAAWAKHLGVHAEITNSIGMKLVLIPPGEFDMGSSEEQITGQRKDRETDKGYCNDVLPWEGPQHHVRITRPRFFGRFLVTQSQYEHVMGKNPSYFVKTWKKSIYRTKEVGTDTGQFPVEQASWEDAIAFCQRLSASPAEKSAHCVYRLPTEAEWEYACRAGTTDLRFCTFKDLDRYAWHIGNSAGRTHEVGQTEPNAWGLYDMYGNVWEWCSDWYSRDYYRQSPLDDPPGPAIGSSRVMRGGCWGWYFYYCRSACRLWNPDPRQNGCGFRIIGEFDTPPVARHGASPAAEGAGFQSPVRLPSPPAGKPAIVPAPSRLAKTPPPLPSGKWFPLPIKPAEIKESDLWGEKMIVSASDGALKLFTTGVTYRKITAKDTSIRAKVKKVSGDVVALHLRGGYVAWFNGNDFGIGMTVKDKPYVELPVRRSSKAISGFFEMEFRAVGDKLSLFADGELVAEVCDLTHVAGGTGISCRGVGLFKNVELFVPDESRH